MTEDPDPRRSVFAKVSVRPSTPTAAPPEPVEADEPAGSGLRRLGAPPPPKPPTVTVMDDPVGGPPASITTPIPAPPPPRPERPQAVKAARQRPATRARPRKEADDEAESFGTQRGNLRYVQTSLSTSLAEALDRRARERRMVVGDVAMEAVQAFTSTVKSGGRPMRRPKGGNPVRKDIGLFPDEAAEVYRAAMSAGYKPSAFLREAIERFFTEPVAQPGG